MPLLIRRTPTAEAYAAAREMLKEIGLADEPTGNLDRQNAEAVFDLMLALNKLNRTAPVLSSSPMTWKSPHTPIAVCA